MFKEALQTIVEKTDGSLGALIMGADGLSVEKFFTDAVFAAEKHGAWQPRRLKHASQEFLDAVVSN